LGIHVGHVVWEGHCHPILLLREHLLLLLVLLLAQKGLVLVSLLHESWVHHTLLRVLLKHVRRGRLLRL
jgi:hypothetical protein